MAPKTPEADKLFPASSIVAPNDGAEADDAPASDWLGDDALQLDDPRFQTAKWTAYRLNPDGTIPEGSRVGRYCGKFEGQLDLEKLRERWGGGVFRLIASLPDRSRTWLQVEIEGAPKVQAPEPEPTAPPSELAALTAQVAELARIVHAPPAAPPPAPADPMQMITAVASLVQTLAPPPPTAAIFDVLEKGINIGQKSTSGGDDSIGSMFREALPGILEAFKPRPRPTVTPAAHTAAARAAAAGPAPTTDATRKQLVVTMLADAHARGVTAGDLAEQADAVLTDGELQGIVAATPEQLLHAIGPELVDKYPALRTDHGLQYIGALITELRRVPDDPPADVVTPEPPDDAPPSDPHAPVVIPSDDDDQAGGIES